MNYMVALHGLWRVECLMLANPYPLMAHQVVGINDYALRLLCADQMPYYKRCY